ncbi:MAG: hypothetical protein ACKVHP_25135 [Verrucomicrobiales bacterium]
MGCDATDEAKPYRPTKKSMEAIAAKFPFKDTDGLEALAGYILKGFAASANRKLTKDARIDPIYLLFT